MSWWRRQRAAFIALGAAVVAVAGVHLWLDALPTVREGDVTIVAAGASSEIAGQRLSLESTAWDEFDAPAGMRTLSILLSASGDEEASICGSTRLTEPSTDRVWLDGRSLLDVPRERGEPSCTVESGPYDVLAVFVVPDDAAGPFELDVPGSGETARFLIEP